MSITFPTFIDKEIVTPEKLNDFVQALEAKFAAGLTSAEIQWPLLAAGNLDMGDYQIVNGKAIWSFYNAAQYADDWDTCLVDAASDGRCIVIPPGTTVTMDGSAMANSSLTIRGSGPTSILQLESGATAGWALRNTSANFSFNLSNLTLDGQDIASSRGIILRGAVDVVIDKVHFKDFALAPLQLIKEGATGCSNVRITNCHFESGSGHHIEGDYVRDLVIEGNTFDTAAQTAIYLKAADATAEILRVDICNNVFRGCTDDVISVLGGNASFNVAQANVNVHDNVANSGNSIKVGSASFKMQYANVSDNVIPSSAGDALTVCVKYGSVSDNVLPGATDNGIDLTVSEDLVVSDNLLVGAGTFAIDYASALGCYIHDNHCGTAAINISTSTATPCQAYGNSDSLVEALPLSTYVKDSGTITIPASSLHVGDVLSIRALINDDASGTSTLTLNGVSVSTVTVAATLDNVSHDARIYIDGTTTAKSIYTAIRENGSVISLGHLPMSGLDLTSDQIVTVGGALGGTFPTYITVSVDRGVAQ